MRGIVTCVEYDDLLAITLPGNLNHLDEVVVVTSPQDARTQRLVESTPRARLHVTDAFYRHGATFNKGMAMEEGFDVLGREGWLMIFDADTLLPPVIDWSFLDPMILYSPSRHMLSDPRTWSPKLDWASLPVAPDGEWAGYCQIFHADSDLIKDVRPWYGINWPHAGGCDSDFQQRWGYARKKRTDFNVLHLGLDCRNWCGRVSPRRDGEKMPNQGNRRVTMARVSNDWDFRLKKLDLSCTEQKEPANVSGKATQ